ncbi:MAG: transketolase [Pseudomonadota bacterium]
MNTFKGIRAMAVTQQQMANAIRALSMDAVQAAKSGHPGMPMGMADVATVLFTKFLKYDAAVPDWADRDRFILSAGHGSMLIYALTYLTGYPGMDIDQIRNFRQLGYKTAGHPEYGHAPGVETTTGPLGQGISNAVGFAMAEAHLAAKYGADLVDHHTYVIAGDGCLMEGISQEAISLAGHLKLGKLIVLWDDNKITIDGAVSLSDSTDQISRFEASGWETTRVDGHDFEAVAAAIAAAQTTDKPSLIACKTIIGKGAPTKQGTSATHGAPLGEEEIAGTRAAMDWPHAPFDMPEDILNAWRTAGQRGAAARTDWESRYTHSNKKAAFDLALATDLTPLAEAIDAYKEGLAAEPQKVATRKASEMALGVINKTLPYTMGGSADLTGSNNTKTGDTAPFTAENREGRYIYYGIREHAMAAAMNGMALHGGVIPYGGTFLVFTDYCRPSIRLAALMGVRSIFVMTHDSIGLGEDGPTHQPVEHLASLRAMPNVNVLRPCDAVETAECWQIALNDADTPSILALTRQGLTPQRTTHVSENLSAKGAYALHEADNAAVTLIASGSEVEIAMDAQAKLSERGIAARVVSAPCFERFQSADAAYRASVLGTAPRIGIEAGVRQGWDTFLGPQDAFIGMSSFGASAPIGDLYRHFGLTMEAVVTAAETLI